MLTQAVFNITVCVCVQAHIHHTHPIPKWLRYSLYLLLVCATAERTKSNMDFPFPQVDKPMFFYVTTGQEEISS